MRRLLPLLLASAVLAAIVTYYFGVEEPARKRQEAAEEAKGKLVSLAREQVSGVELTRNHETVRLERDATGHWWLREPRVAPARAATVDDLLYAVTTLHAERTLPLAEGEASDYGTGDTAATIHLTGESIDTTVRLGNRATVGLDRTYVQVGEQLAICSTPLTATVNQPLATFLREQLFDTDRWRAVHLEVADGDRSWSVAKDAAGGWHLDGGVEADPEQVEGWLAALDETKADPLIAGEPPAAARWAEVRIYPEAAAATPGATPGATPAATAANAPPAAPATPATPATVVRIARDGTGDVAATQVGLGFWGRLAPAAVAKLLPDPEGLKDRHLVHFHAFDVDRLELRSPQGLLTLRHHDGEWAGDDGTAVDGQRVDDYLQTLEDARATGYLEGDQPPVKGPELSLYRSTQLLASLAFGGEGDARARRLPNGPTLQLTPATLAQLLPTPGRFLAATGPPSKTSP
ncbi:MAG: DUF4340 domain-containing protein [Deltaproteobacteria bacterium]|nr:DUF4340 domain-containing protein [Deltaproteobacteria bacterium]